MPDGLAGATDEGIDEHVLGLRRSRSVAVRKVVVEADQP